MASERLSWGFSRGAKALAGSRRASDTLSAKARRAIRAAPQVSGPHSPSLGCAAQAVVLTAILWIAWPVVHGCRV